MKKLRASVEEVRRHAELFRGKVLAYNDRFNTDHHEVFAAFLTQLRDSNKELVKKRDLGIKKSVDVNFTLVNEMFSH